MRYSAYPKTPRQLAVAHLFELYSVLGLTRHAMHYRWSYLDRQKAFLQDAFGVGGNAERTNLDMVDALCDALERLAPAASNPALRAAGIARYHDLKTFVADRPGHDRRYAIDASKLARELGFAPSRTFEQGIGATVAWYLQNRDWCAAVTRGTYERQRLGLEGGRK